MEPVGRRIAIATSGAKRSTLGICRSLHALRLASFLCVRGNSSPEGNKMAYSAKPDIYSICLKCIHSCKTKGLGERKPKIKKWIVHFHTRKAKELVRILKDWKY